MSLELVPTGEMQVEVHGFSDRQEQLLAEALPTSLIKERKGPGGRMLKYIAGKTSIDNANRIFGFGKWGYRVLSKSHEKCGDSEYYTADIELYVLGCPFPFPGEGVGVVTSNNVEGHEKARKEAVTDAMKRALRHFGDQFGLALYSEDSLVEDAQGNLVPVRNVHPQNGNAPAPARKTVDATPTTRPNAPESRNGHTPKSHTATEAKGQPAPVQSQLSVLGKAIIAAKECGFITGATPDERAASWQEQLNQIFDGNVPPEADLKQPANLARVNGAIEAHRRHVAERKATSGK